MSATKESGAFEQRGKERKKQLDESICKLVRFSNPNAKRINIKKADGRVDVYVE